METDSFKVNQKRVVISVGGGCKHGCIYCISRSRDYKKPRKTEAMLSVLKKLCKDPRLETIQLGYDVEPFENQNNGLKFIKQTLKFRKNITFATKIEFTEKTARAISKINKTLKNKNKYLCAVVSFSCWDSAYRVEPNAPSPDKRLNTVRRLSKYGVPVIIALKPILPFIATRELLKLLDESKIAGAEAVVIAELNLDKKGDILNSIKEAGYSINEADLEITRLSWTTNPKLEWLSYPDSRTNSLFNYAKSIGLPPFRQTIKAVNKIIKDKSQHGIKEKSYK